MSMHVAVTLLLGHTGVCGLIAQLVAYTLGLCSSQLASGRWCRTRGVACTLASSNVGWGRVELA